MKKPAACGLNAALWSRCAVPEGDVYAIGSAAVSRSAQHRLNLSVDCEIMNTKCRSICSVVFLICLVGVVNSQDTAKWLVEVEQALQREGWKETRKNTIIDSKTKKFVSVSVLLENNETHTSIVIEQQGSVSEAREQFRSHLLAYRVTNKKVTVNKYVGLGDENLVVGGGTGWVRITFRKGRVITDIRPPTEETAEKMARLIAGAIPAKN